MTCLTETHDFGKLKKNRNFIPSEPAPSHDSYSGVALLLANCVTHSTNYGSRIVYMAVRLKPCNLIIIGVYMQEKIRKRKPFASDTKKHKKN